MISYLQAQRLASQAGVPVEIIEKDYLIELLLFYLSRDEYLNETLIFRGGTSLKKIYFQDYRFSEDLDFLVAVRPKEVIAAYPDPESWDLVPNQISFKEIERKSENLLNKISADYPFRLTQKPEINSDHIQSFINYDIIPEIKVEKMLKVDILKDAVVPGHNFRTILFSYEEFKKDTCGIRTYNLESVVSDKISRILDVDKEARDIYDLWYLLKTDINIGKVKEELINRFGYKIYLTNILTEIKKEAYRRNWQIRLTYQIANLPDYDIVINELTELIKSKFIN